MKTNNADAMITICVETTFHRSQFSLLSCSKAGNCILQSLSLLLILSALAVLRFSVLDNRFGILTMYH